MMSQQKVQQNPGGEEQGTALAPRQAGGQHGEFLLTDLAPLQPSLDVLEPDPVLIRSEGLVAGPGRSHSVRASGAVLG
jgi:hypothetical protein